jgi:hypothetical protein
MRPMLRRAAACLAYLALASCAGAPSAIGSAPGARAATTGAPCGTFGAHASLALDRSSLRASDASARLLSRLDESAYRYFRALGPEYALRTCEEFRDVRWRLPLVAIHGDAHLEQFVVTPSSAGIEDFDQSGFGPAVVDLVRYAASIHLACREAPVRCDADAGVDVYFKAYRASLDRASDRKQPAIVDRLRRGAPHDADAWLRWADGLMQPLAPETEARTRKGWLAFRRLVLEVRPDRPPEYYDVVRVGALQMGVGSGLETKLLFRIRGATDAPGDDVILEARSTHPPVGNECAWRPQHGASLHPLTFMSILGPRMPETYGYATLDDGALPFWVQAWVPGYRELSIGDLQNDADVAELAEDAARQLAGHFWTRFPEPLRALQRRAQLEAFDLVDARARRLAKELADETVHEWGRFRANAATR